LPIRAVSAPDIDPAGRDFDDSATVDAVRESRTSRQPGPTSQPGPVTAATHRVNPQGASLLAVQRTAGNAAAVELLRRSRLSAAVVMRQPVETETEPTADPAPGDATASTTTRTLRQGSTGEDVKILQMKLRHLRERQHDRDAAGRARIDGIFGPLTHKDVVDFQTDTGLDADGIVGPKTRDALDSLVPQTPIESETLASDERFAAAVELRQSGQLDAALAEFDAMRGEEPQPEAASILDANAAICHHQRGRFGFAVERYEQALTGRFNQEAFRRATLDNLSLARQNQFLASPPPDPEPAVVGPGGEPPGREGGGITERQVVQFGDANGSSDLFKGKLANVLAGWDPTLAPGIDFDPTAEARTRLFQQATGLEVTGIADAVTWHAIDTYSRADVPFSIVQPILTRLSAGANLSDSDPEAGLRELEAAQTDARSLGLDHLVTHSEAVIGRAHHRLSRFEEAISHYTTYLPRVFVRTEHYGAVLELLRRAHERLPPS
jgi:peptidoglycan hydrolase-like protein with peptidoglycan-binding domain